ncbi:thiamine pyrophosphate-requiring protein [Benzoatithermus flavus]|uniref:Thiamine pyrophosphate-requiring protein n=1 Tax=Benzoatithermus flavus TaxID=3108223 RepID=A0ABU8XP00_9PROT
MTEIRLPAATVAEALLATLAARGVDHLLANAGTDFAPLIEGFARAPSSGLRLPTPLAIPHEQAAIAMAHGYWLATGRPQAVMVHVNVGLANTLMGVINAARDNVPLLLLSGRTPIGEAGRTGSRDLPIHWGQEMRDQGGMLRELVKWDYELRYPEQVPEIVDRALAIATSPPMGPVHLALPREVLCEPVDGLVLPEIPRQHATAPAVPAPAALAEAADLVAAARHPLVLTQRAGGFPDGFSALAGIAERFALPVVEFWPPRISLPVDHPMHAGFDPAGPLAEADLVLVVDALVPWIPLRHKLPTDCRVIQLGPDPLFASTPVRGFPCDLALSGDVAQSLRLLGALLEERLPASSRIVAERYERLAARHAAARAARLAAADRGAGPPMLPGFVARRLAETLPEDAILFSELGCDPSVMAFRTPGSYFGFPLAGGLGWGLPAALGAQLARPERVVVATVGDGSYLFANPVACHQVAEALRLPVLTVILNNGMWNAVHKTTRMVYPDGHAARANAMPLTSLEPAPDYSLIARASRGHAERVELPDELPGALARALDVVRRERRQVLLDVRVAPA